MAVLKGLQLKMKFIASLRSRQLPCLLQHVKFMSTVPGSFKADDLAIELTKTPKAKPADPDKLLFGKEFSDHMLEIDWNTETGWGKPRISPVKPFQMHPASKVFHYAIELFEGMKSYHGVDGRVRLFRPDKNMERMRNSARRSAFPDFDTTELTKLIKKLVQVDREWVPRTTKSSLYIRPTMIATEAGLGVSKTLSCKLFVITGPVGPYYPTGFNPISLLADPRYVRSFEGGCGNYKMGANYAPTIQIQVEALQKYNCQQVLWLYGKEHRITEVGAMNVFLFWTNENGEKELITPPLESGLILPGVTRFSLLDLSRKWGEFKVTEGDVTMAQIVKGLQENRVYELFGAGTACVVCPVDGIFYAGQKHHIPTMDAGAPMTNRFFKELTDIQYGRKPSEWVVDIDDEEAVNRASVSIR